MDHPPPLPSGKLGHPWFTVVNTYGSNFASIKKKSFHQPKFLWFMFHVIPVLKISVHTTYGKSLAWNKVLTVHGQSQVISSWWKRKLQPKRFFFFFFLEHRLCIISAWSTINFDWTYLIFAFDSWGHEAGTCMSPAYWLVISKRDSFWL